MTRLEMINVALCVLSFFLSAISVYSAVAAIKQNNRMLEASTRPYLCIFGEEINTGAPAFYLVVKNCGTSSAHLKRFSISPDLSSCYSAPNARNFLSDLNDAIIAPGQSRVCHLDYSHLPDHIAIDMVYESVARKTYQEHFSGNIKTGAAMLASKYDGDALRGISYTLQDYLIKRI